MNIEEKLKAAMLLFLHDHGHPNAKEVIDFEEDSYEDGYCETCAYTRYTVEINYRDEHGTWLSYVYDGRFSYLISALAEYDVE